MVDTLEVLARAQAGTASPLNSVHSSGSAAASRDERDFSDSVVLSEMAMQSLTLQQTAGTEETANSDEQGSATSVQVAISQTVNDLAWLFNVLSPPHVDSSVVMRAVNERATADGTGVNPPLSLFRAWADRADKTPALYVENLDVTTSASGTIASVDRVTLTTIDPTLAKGTTTANGTPSVLDLGGEAAKLAAYQAGAAAGWNEGNGQMRSLLVIRQGGQATADNTLRVRLDALLPLA